MMKGCEQVVTQKLKRDELEILLTANKEHSRTT